MAYRSAEHLDDILVPLHRFFDQIWNHWYTNHVSPLGDSLFASYDASWDGALSARLSAWQALEKLRTFAGVPASLPEPRRWLTVNHEECHLVRSARTAVTHGDLHGDNLFVDDRNAWPIDFERTGPGPILRDFVELIQDLLTRAARFSLADLPVFYELAVAICTPIRPDQRMQMTQAIKDHVEARKAFAVVQDLQLLAARRTQYTDRREYLWGLLLNSLFVVRLLDQEQDVTRQELTLLLAAVICDRLARWGNRNWRPKDSPPLNWIATRRKVITKPVRPRPDPATGETENLNADSSSTTPTGTDTSLQGGIIRGPVQIKLAPTLDSRAPVLHLELTLRPQGEHALAVWEAHVLGVRESTLTPPFGGQDLALVVRALDALQHPNYPAPMARNQYRIFTFSPEEQVRLAALGLWNTGATRLPADAHQRVGRRLYKALIADPIAATALRTVRDHATANGQRLALALRFPPEAVELAALPWELLWDEEPAPLMFSRGVRSDCTRHLDLAQALPPARPRQRPLRILAIAPLTGIDKDTRAGERDARQAAWQPLVAQGLVTVREVSPATRVAITNAIHQEQPDIIHYYGHGRYEAGTGALMLDETGGGKSWTDAPRLMTLFGGARLVALFACQGAMVGDDDSVGLLTGIAPALSAAGVPLVVGMQLTTRVSAATRASAVLYGALASGQSVQEAVARARQALYFEENDQASWYLPTLYVRSRETGPAFV
ncbi:MAG TPA: CHAT domain-containing protein [Roseiflexaceae bacterium]|nr:CHAT domain-containing protein [Roseiflexaceae bacterium]